MGLGVALWLGPRWAAVAIVPLPALMLAAACAASALAIAAAWWPARLAARLDPCLCFREI